MESTHTTFHRHAQAWLVLGASLVVLVASTKNCDDTNHCTGLNGWAVAASVVSTALTLFYVLLTMFNTTYSEKVAPYLAIFLAIWWLPGAFVLTFDGPFVFTSNGYYGAWAALIFAVQWFQLAGQSMFQPQAAASNAPGTINAHGTMVPLPKV